VIDLRPLAAADGLVAVAATYHLDNPFGDKHLDLVFATGSATAGFHVALDGRQVPFVFTRARTCPRAGALRARLRCSTVASSATSSTTKRRRSASGSTYRRAATISRSRMAPARSDITSRRWTFGTRREACGRLHPKRKLQATT
jgi:hypothetical protein